MVENVFGTTPPAGGGFGGAVKPEGGVDDENIGCDPLAVFPGDPPQDPAPLPYDKHNTIDTDLQYPEWSFGSTCATLTVINLNMYQNWDKLKKKGFPNLKPTPIPYGKAGGMIKPTLPNVMNPDTMNKLRECMLKNYGIDIKDGLPPRLTEHLFECKMEHFSNEHGLPPEKPDIFHPSPDNLMTCPPHCKHQNVYLSYTVSRNCCYSFTGKIGGGLLITFGTLTSVACNKVRFGHALHAKIVSCNKKKICFEGFDGFPQGGNIRRVCMTPDGKIIEEDVRRSGSLRLMEDPGACKKIVEADPDNYSSSKACCWEKIPPEGEPKVRVRGVTTVGPCK